jgi:peptidoglycan/xylan/chitin deacetylase (PgdA/CDA1 family)
VVWRSRLKHVVETALVGTGFARLARRRRRGDALILAYHNIVPDGAAPFGDPGLHLPQAAFAAQLDALTTVCDVVSLEAVLGPTTARPARPRAALTFDDAYSGALTAGLDECAARGLPATVFAVPGCLGGEAFWWDAWTPPAGAAWPDAERAHALEQCAGAADAVAAFARQRGFVARSTPPHARTVTEAALRAAAARPGVTVAPHSWTHANLARLDGATLVAELERPLRWLRDRPGRVLPVLAYPYGRRSPAVAAAARAVGYTAGLLIAGGWWRGGDPFAVPRVNISAGLSPAGFALRTAGLFCR